MAIGAQRFVPDGANLEQLRSTVGACQGCDLFRGATQAVFSRGRADAPLVLVGEQPGDEEDKARTSLRRSGGTAFSSAPCARLASRPTRRM